MRIIDLKYLLGYTLPISLIYSIHFDIYLGFWLTPFIAFILIPFLETFLKGSTENLLDIEKINKTNHPFFDILLFLNVPLVLYCIYLVSNTMMTQHIELLSQLGLMFSLGIVMASNGINVAHELGHRSGLLPQMAAKILLTPSLYNHFTIEHNRGHHLHVGTPMDAATARKNEVLYFFWIRSTILSYINAWKLESTRLTKSFGIVKVFKNEMVWNTIISMAYICMLMYFTKLSGFWIIASGVISILFLETINYIEHYGLQRKLTESGRYERVESIHSWNSNHTIGRLVLYELTRHSDHHYKANKEYQLLDHHDASPQLPHGYPASMLIALIPPLWMSLMNGKLELLN